MRAVEEYLAFDPCAGEEGDVSCRTVRLVVARREHPCFLGMRPFGDGHTIAKGEKYRYEKALVDRSFWGEYRVCLRCIDRWFEGE